MRSELDSGHAVSGNTPKHTGKHTKHARKHYPAHVKNRKNTTKHGMHRIMRYVYLYGCGGQFWFCMGAVGC